MLLRLRAWALYHLNELGDGAQQAILIGEPLAEDFERVLGPDHPGTLTSRSNLAVAYRAAGQRGWRRSRWTRRFWPPGSGCRARTTPTP